MIQGGSSCGAIAGEGWSVARFIATWLQSWPEPCQISASQVNRKRDLPDVIFFACRPVQLLLKFAELLVQFFQLRFLGQFVLIGLLDIFADRGGKIAGVADRFHLGLGLQLPELDLRLQGANSRLHSISFIFQGLDFLAEFPDFLIILPDDLAPGLIHDPEFAGLIQTGDQRIGISLGGKREKRFFQIFRRGDLQFRNFHNLRGSREQRDLTGNGPSLIGMKKEKKGKTDQTNSASRMFHWFPPVLKKHRKTKTQKDHERPFESFPLELANAAKQSHE